MRKLFYFFGVLSTLLMNGCTEDRNLTEQYIKTTIEEHKDGGFSSIKINSFYSTTCYDGVAYLEFTAYKFNSMKGLVIAADQYYAQRHRSAGSSALAGVVDYVQLNADQCKNILDNYKSLQQKLKSDKPASNEEVYEDYTVSKDLFISFSKNTNSFDGSTIDLWVKGQKYPLPSSSLVNVLNKFIKY